VIVPSVDEEAWCRVVSEAHINGIPTIASDLGGFPESVGPGGLLVSPPDSLDRWLEALSEVWDDQGTYGELSRRALEYSRRDLLEPTVVRRRFEEIVDQVGGIHAASCVKGVRL
jgi:glycosyltransferase involved in cell wall biosynthesis